MDKKNKTVNKKDTLKELKERNKVLEKTINNLENKFNEPSLINNLLVELDQLNKLNEVIKNSLIINEDYGIIEEMNSGKPVLFKPGANKIIHCFKLEPEIINKIIIDRSGYFEITFEIKLKDRSGKVVSIGIGCFSSDEAFILNRTNGDVRKVNGEKNTIFKMALKRALVDAVLNIASISSIFTQDLEDKRIYKTSPPTPINNTNSVYQAQHTNNNNGIVNKSVVQNWYNELSHLDPETRNHRLKYVISVFNQETNLSIRNAYQVPRNHTDLFFKLLQQNKN